MTLGRKRTKEINITLRGKDIAKHETIKYLGVTIDKDLTWKSHLTNTCNKAFAAVAAIRRSTSYLPCQTRKMLYNALVLPHMDYCSVVWHSCSSKLSQSLERVQNYGMRVILSKPPRTPSAPLRHKLNWTTLHQRRHINMLCQVHRVMLSQAPAYMANKFNTNSTLYHSTRGANKIHLKRPNTNLYKQSFEFQGAFHYNELNSNIRTLSSVVDFKTALSGKSFFFFFVFVVVLYLLYLFIVAE